MPGNPKLSRGRFFWAHIICAVAGAAVSVLVITAEGSHPPLIIFLPVILVVWALGHLAIWGIRLLARKGRDRSNEPGPWPPGLILALVGAGAGALFGIFQLLSLYWGARIFADDGLSLMIVWIVHALCFSGILLRHNGSRYLAAALSFGWAALLGRQIQDYLFHHQGSIGFDTLAAFAAVSLLVIFEIHLLRSRRIRRFLGGFFGEDASGTDRS